MIKESLQSPEFSLEELQREMEQSEIEHRQEQEQMERFYAEEEQMDLEMERQRLEIERWEREGTEEERQQEQEEEFLAEIENGYMSPDMLTGLGRSAVEYNFQKTNETVAGRLDIAQSREGNIQADLAEVRSQLSNLDEWQIEEANVLLSRQPDSAWLDEALGIEEIDKEIGVKPYIEMLTAENEAGDYAVNDALLINFLEWHNYALAQEQEKLDAYSEGLKGSYKKDFATAVEAGWIPKSALKNLNRLNDTTLVIDDGFDTSLYGIAGIATPKIDEEDDYKIKISPNEIDDPRALLLHEFSHTAHGENEADDTEFADIPEGGMKRLFDGRGGTVIDEAVVEHFSDSMLRGEVDNLNPWSDVRKEATYFAPRVLLDVLANKGANKIDIRDFFAAHFENGREAKEAGKNSAQAHLVKKLNEAFPFTDVIHEIAELNITDEMGIETYAKLLKDQAAEDQALLSK